MGLVILPARFFSIITNVHYALATPYSKCSNSSSLPNESEYGLHHSDDNSMVIKDTKVGVIHLFTICKPTKTSFIVPTKKPYGYAASLALI